MLIGGAALIVIVAIIMLPMTGGKDDQSGSSAKVPTSSASLDGPATNLAIIENGKSDQATVRAMASGLDRLKAAGCPDSRVELSNYVAGAWRELNAKGKTVSVATILSGITTAVPSGNTRPCSEIAAVYVILVLDGARP